MVPVHLHGTDDIDVLFYLVDTSTSVAAGNLVPWSVEQDGLCTGGIERIVVCQLVIYEHIGPHAGLVRREDQFVVIDVVFFQPLSSQCVTDAGVSTKRPVGDDDDFVTHGRHQVDSLHIPLTYRPGENVPGISTLVAELNEFVVAPTPILVPIPIWVWVGTRLPKVALADVLQVPVTGVSKVESNPV